MVPKQVCNIIADYRCFRAVLFRMVPKPSWRGCIICERFRAVLFRMVPKLMDITKVFALSFRAVLFRMVPKLRLRQNLIPLSFRAVLFRVSKTYYLYDITEYFKNEGVLYGE